ncbi:MAG: M20 family metallopeptidase [Chloroflexia bacterium]|nr:M20 family metallopeptidase [Chloroflexia bacterium]
MAATAVDRDEIVERTQRLVRIPSQYIEGELVQHAEIARELATAMREVGLEVTVEEPLPDYPVVVGSTGPADGGPTIGVIGHYSTVAIGDPAEWKHEPLGAEVVGDRIYGRGTADQKGGIAAVIVAAKNLVASGADLKGRLRLLLVPGEGCTEMALEPVVAQTPDAVRCDIYLDSDGGPGKISLVHGGWIWLELTVSGKGGHSGALTSEGTVPINPIAKLVDVLARLQVPDWLHGERHPLFGQEYGRYSEDPIVDINVLRAGSKVNIIPNEARAQVDIRMLPSQSIAGTLADLDRVLDELRARDPELEVAYRVLNRSKNPHEVSPDHPVIAAIRETCRELGEPEPKLAGSFGGGRAALAEMGPVLHFGAGGGSGAHAPDEYASIDRLVVGARLHARLYERLLT